MCPCVYVPTCHFTFPPQVDRKDLETDLNAQLSEHLGKIESLTQEFALLQSRLTTCEDEKGAMAKVSEDAKHAAESCEVKLQDLIEEKVRWYAGTYIVAGVRTCMSYCVSFIYSVCLASFFGN